MTRKVTHSACSRPGSASTAVQLSRPEGVMAPMPSHVVKLSTITPSSGTTPNAMKTTRAGSAIQARTRSAPAGGTAGTGAGRAAGGASAVTDR